MRNLRANYVQTRESILVQSEFNTTGEVVVCVLTRSEARLQSGVVVDNAREVPNRCDESCSS
ncbi:hypothetical protein C8039_15550 [Halogeometricum sp. wsp3]|nr:hypothetical protein C8039_15550 [Halogeometricum sp. wsp3]